MGNNTHTFQFAAVLTKTTDEDVWGGYFPNGPGAFGAGHTYEEAKESLIQGLHIYLDYALECGSPIKESEELPKLADIQKEDPEAVTIEWVKVDKPVRRNA